MIKKQVYLFFISCITAMILSCTIIFWWLCTSTHHEKNNDFSHQSDSNASPQPEIVMNNLSLHQVCSAKKNGWTLSSLKSSFIKPLNTVECETVTCTLVTNCSEVATLSAEKSIIDQNKKTLFLSGPFKGTFKGITVSGNDMSYTLSSHQLKTTHHSVFSHAHFTMTATTSSLDLKDKKVILNGVKSEFLKN